MTYTTASGVEIPQGTDAFSPTTQFKVWADEAAKTQNHYIVADDTARNALTTPQLREGIACYVKSTKTRWVYDGSTWFVSSEDTGWQTPTLSNSWVNFGSPYRTAAYRRLDGVVYLTGLIRNGTATAGTTVLNLPVGFRPAATLMLPTESSNVFALVSVDSAGDLKIVSGVASGGSLSLHTSFIAEG